MWLAAAMADDHQFGQRIYSRQREAGITGLQHLLKTPPVRESYYRFMQAVLEQDLDRAADTSPYHPEAPEVDAIDPSQPTLGLRTQVAVGGGVLLASAAYRLRQDGEDICNVAILPDLAFSDEYITRKGLFAGMAFVADTDITLTSRQFSPALQIDAIPSTQLGRAGNTGQRLRFINEPAIEEVLVDKRKCHALLARSGILHAPALLENVPPDDPALYHILSRAYDSGEAVVIKPVLGERGQGVLMVDPAELPADEVFRRLRHTYVQDEQLVVEPWVRSRELRSPETSVRQDWNIRALIMGGTLVGGYARIGAMGTPINMAKGARAESLPSVLERCGLSDYQSQLVYGSLHELAERLHSVLPAACMGVDIIIDEQLQPTLIEVNGERSGGLKNTITAGRDIADWKIAAEAVRSLHRTLFRHRRPAGLSPLPIRQQPLPDISQLVRGLFDARILGNDQYRERAVEYLSMLKNTKAEERQAVDTALAYAAWKQAKGPANAAAAAARLPELHLDIFSELYDRGRTKEAFQHLNTYADADPDDRHRQQNCAFALMDKMSKDKQLWHGENHMSPQAATAFARTTLFAAISALKIDQLAISQATRQTIAASLAASFHSRKQHEPLIDLDSVPMNQPERTYLRPLARYINGMQAICQNDAGIMTNVFEEALSSPTEIDKILAAIWLGNLEDMDYHTAKESDATSYFIAFLIKEEMGFAAMFYTKDGADRMRQNQAMDLFTNRELNANSEKTSLLQANELWNTLITAFSKAIAGEYDQATSGLRRYQTLTHHFTRMPFAVTYASTCRILDELQDGIRSL